jgi:hypothetical protein
LAIRVLFDGASDDRCSGPIFAYSEAIDQRLYIKRQADERLIPLRLASILWHDGLLSGYTIPHIGTMRGIVLQDYLWFL